MSDSVQPHRQQPTRLPCPWDSPGKSTGVGCHALLQGIVSTQGPTSPALAGGSFTTGRPYQFIDPTSSGGQSLTLSLAQAKAVKMSLPTVTGLLL